MDYSSIFAVSAAGMALERTRVEVAALNLANAHTTAAPGQTPFSPLRVVGSPPQQTSFAAAMLGSGSGSGSTAPFAIKPTYRVEAATVAPRQVHEPGHPLADGQGFVRYPGVDPAAEMVTLMGASRAYEANVAAMNTARTMALKALDIGGTQ